jgi:hypothetical protein
MLPGARHRAHDLADVPARFKDYISTPKQNDYRSIHTTVIGPASSASSCRSAPRDARDRRIRHRGACALQGRHGSPPRCCRARSNAYAWLRRTIELLAEGSNPEEFLEHTKLELFHDQVFCFTPKGPLIALPRKATGIDFAYAVHTDVGNSAVGAKINGKIAPLVSELQNGDEVEITRRMRRPRRPPPGESVVVTARRAPRSGARRAPPCARNMSGSDGGMVEACSSAPRKDYSDEKAARARCRASRAPRSTRGWRRSDAAR